MFRQSLNNRTLWKSGDDDDSHSKQFDVLYSVSMMYVRLYASYAQLWLFVVCSERGQSESNEQQTGLHYMLDSVMPFMQVCASFYIQKFNSIQNSLFSTQPIVHTTFLHTTC